MSFKRSFLTTPLLAVLFAATVQGAGARVIINEIMYHAPDDLDDLQFVELYNTSDHDIDLGGWSFTKGIKFKFPAGQRIGSKGYLVLCRSAERFKEFYQVPVAGVFSSSLSHKGENVELTDASGQEADSLNFKDSYPWPTGPDGYSGSLERINPEAPTDDAANWASSPLSEDRDRPGGTPGRPNHNLSAELPPVIQGVRFEPEFPAPNQAITVDAELRGTNSPTQVDLLFRVAGPGFEKPETRVAMKKVADQRYSAVIPGQLAEQLVRFRVEVAGSGGAKRHFPSEKEPRPALSAYVQGPFEPALIPFGWILQTTEAEFEAAQQRANFTTEFRRGGFRGGPPRRGGPGGPGRFRGPGGPGWSRGPVGPGGPFGQEESESGSHRSAFVYFDPVTRKTKLFDFVQVSPRKGGQKIRFLKDQPLRAMTTINLIFENETASVVEPLAYEVYRRAGMAVEQSYHIRLWQSGQPVGYHLLIEQPNGAFLRRNQIRDDGNMYKLLWYERDVVGQHEKKSNTRSGHDDIVALVESLNRTTGAAQWEVIRRNFDVQQVATYFAVNMVLSHWDGFFNNYFTYHDVKGSGKWTMYPWDQDSTWGLRDYAFDHQIFYTMSITFGMNGDEESSGGGGPWRPPGWFSGPLLANPVFRKHFLARTREILETVYTEQVFASVLALMQRQLIPEARFRAEIQKSDPDRAVQDLKGHFAACLQHLRKRREFLLGQKEIKAVGKPSL
jgi:hypothetical protein